MTGQRTVAETTEPSRPWRRSAPAVIGMTGLVALLALAASVPDPTTTTSEATPRLSPPPTLPAAPASVRPLAKVPATATPAERTTVTPTASPSARPPGTEPWGYGGYGTKATTASPGATVSLLLYHYESYEGEDLQSFVEVARPEGDRRLPLVVRIDYGDGTTTDMGLENWRCQDPEQPNPYTFSAARHRYAAPGEYQVTATVTTGSCGQHPEVWELTDQQTVAVRSPVIVHAGRRP